MKILSGFMKHNDLTILKDEKDYSEMIHTVKRESLNTYEYVHGGIYYSLADAAAGIASRSDGNNYVTMSSSFNYLKAVKEGVLIAKANIVNRTSKITVVDVKVFNDLDEIVSSGTFTMYRVGVRL